MYCSHGEIMPCGQCFAEQPKMTKTQELNNEKIMADWIAEQDEKMEDVMTK